MMDNKNGKNESPITDEMAQILFTNLLLLGLDVTDMEAHFKINFNKNMFNLPNKVGAEAVLHFLFFCLNPELSEERFRDCWPILDKKREVQFRKTCNSWIVSIQKNDANAHLPLLNPALLLSPGGRKFIHFIYSFSTYVLTQVMKREYDWKPNCCLHYPSVTQSNKSYGTVMLSAIRDGTVAEMKDFFKHLHLISGANHSWKAYAGDLVKEYRDLKKKLRDIESEKRQLVNQIADTALKLGCTLPTKRTLTMFDSGTGAVGIKRGQRLEQARKQWRSLKNFGELFNKKREIVESIVNDSLSRHKLDGTEIGVCVPGLLLREFKREIQKQQIDNVYVGGRLSLIPVLQMWNLCLRRYFEQISSEDLPDLSREIADLNGQAHKHHSFVKDTQALRDEMVNVIIPDLEQSIEELREKLKSRDFNMQSSLGLELTKPTSPASLPPDLSLPTENESPLNPLLSQSAAKDTPEAIVALMQSVTAKSQTVRTIQPSKLVHAFPNLGQTKQSSLSATKKDEDVNRKGASLKGSGIPGSKISVAAKRSNIPTNNAQSQSSSRPSSGSQTAFNNVQKQKSHKTAMERANHSVLQSSKFKPKKDAKYQQKHKALDILANSIVDSVMFSDDEKQQDFRAANDDTFSNGTISSTFLSEAFASELEISAFISRDRLGRSPQEENVSAMKDSMDTPPSRFYDPPTVSHPVKEETPTPVKKDVEPSTLGHETPKGQNASSQLLARMNYLKSLRSSSYKADRPVRTPSQDLLNTSQSASLHESQLKLDTLSGSDDFFFDRDHHQTSGSQLAGHSDSPVRDYALEHNISSITPAICSQPEQIDKSDSENTDLFISPSEAFQGEEEDLLDLSLTNRPRNKAKTGTFDATVDVGVSEILGDRPCGDGEASEELTTYPTGRVVFGNNFISNDVDQASQGYDGEEDDTGMTVAQQTNKLVSSFSALEDFIEINSNSRLDRSEDLLEQASSDHLKGECSNSVHHSFLNFNEVLDQSVNLVESDEEDGLNDSFVPLKQGIHLSTASVERKELGNDSPILKVTDKGINFSANLFNHPMTFENESSPNENHYQQSLQMPTNMSERLAELQAKVAQALNDSDDD